MWFRKWNQSETKGHTLPLNAAYFLHYVAVYFSIDWLIDLFGFFFKSKDQFELMAWAAAISTSAEKAHSWMLSVKPTAAAEVAWFRRKIIERRKLKMGNSGWVRDVHYAPFQQATLLMQQ